MVYRGENSNKGEEKEGRKGEGEGRREGGRNHFIFEYNIGSFEAVSSLSY